MAYQEESMNVLFNGEKVALKISRGYRHMPKQPFIEAFCLDGEPYASVTVCIPNVSLGEDETVLDTNNIPDSLHSLVESGCVEYSGRTVRSGFCEYPVVRVLAPIK